MNKCDCYHIEKRRKYSYNPVTGDPIGYDVHEGVCWGTKECENCSCGGNQIQCDFYPEVRNKARENIKIEDAINHFKYGISHDIFSEPVTSYAKLAIKALENYRKDKKYEQI